MLEGGGIKNNLGNVKGATIIKDTTKKGGTHCPEARINFQTKFVNAELSGAKPYLVTH